MRAFLGALALALAVTALTGQSIDACGGMTTVNPPPLTLDDPIDPPDFTPDDPEDLGDGECIL